MNTEMSDFFPWNNSFVTGIEQIDRQHKKLVRLTNRLSACLFTDVAEDVLTSAFDELAGYALHHFETEQAIWDKYLPAFSATKEHASVHGNFLPKVLEIKVRAIDEPLDDALEEILLFLTSWLVHHILGDDMRMSKIVLGIESGMTIEQSIQQADMQMPEILRNTPLGLYDHFCQRTLELKREVNERKKYSQKLSLLSQIFNDTRERIIITDADKNIIDVNPAYCEIAGYNLEEVIGRTPDILNSGKQSSNFYTDMWQAINEEGYWKGEIWNRSKNGGLYAELLTISKLVNDDNEITNYVGIGADITDSKKHKEKLDFMAHYDLLTGLPNRTLFNERFHQAIARTKRAEQQLAICFLDIDKFKPINDNYGHSIGDQLLVAVAERILNELREDDTVARLGGDEFTLLLHGIKNAEAYNKALARIQNLFSEPFLVEGHSHYVTASIGVTLFPADSADIDTLLRHADHAMYKAKQAGRNRYHLFNVKEDQEITRQRNDLVAIERALENSELCLYYQPKVNMLTGEVLGVEALIRWEHPEKGLIPPLDFLPVVEGTELEPRIGIWVVDQALKQLNFWHKHNFNVGCSVNIPSMFLLSDSFLAQLEHALKSYPAVKPKYLELEILESSAILDLSVARKVIEACQMNLGVNVSLDDFGTGFSSLTHLRSLPVNTIKIDQSFVRGMLDDPGDYAIVDGIIGLADSFDRKVLAEGVETVEQGLLLIDMGCRQAQGYVIAKPMPASDVAGWAADYQPSREWLSRSSEYCDIKRRKIQL